MLCTYDMCTFLVVPEAAPRSARVPVVCCSSSAMARRVWEANRAAWRLATRADTHYSADRRLYKKQLSELRKEWVLEDLMARREAYVNARKEADHKAEHKAAQSTDRTAQIAAEREELAQRMVAERASVEKQQANAQRVGEARAAKRTAVETEFRRKWMERLLNDYDVEGSAEITFARSSKRSWFQPDENFEHKLKLALMQRHSPVDKWNATARKLLHEEEQEKIQSRLGGAMVTPAGPPTTSPGMQPPSVPSTGGLWSSAVGASAASATPPEPDAFDKDFIKVLEDAIRDGEAPPDTPRDAGRTDGADDDRTGEGNK